MSNVARERTYDPDAPAPPPPGLGPRELARWAWRQLTSMRTALLLLLLLAVAAVPGSLIPQDDVDSFKALQYRDDHPQLAPVFDALGLFNVYSSPWFSAIYLLLMTSLVGCILPRTKVYWRALKARPPKAPRNLSRMPISASHALADEASAEEVLARAAATLKARRYRVEHFPGEDGDQFVSAERGYLREAGNLVFHLAVLVVLVGVAAGSLFGYKGGMIIVTGNGFSNVLTQYDDFIPGAFFDPEELAPYSFTVNDFDVDFIIEGEQRGLPQDFTARVTYRNSPGDEPTDYALAVNHPLRLDGGDVYLVGHGYAPHITVRDGEGEVAYSGPTVFLPEDPSFRSFGVVKVPSAEPEQIGLEGFFYPTFAMVDGDPMTVYPDAANPLISMLVYAGDLGLSEGSQSVYTLRKDALEQVTGDDGKPTRIDLSPGQVADLPDGLGTVEFAGLSRWVKLQTAHTPGTFVALGGVVLALLGLMLSLFIRPRRVWVRLREVTSERRGDHQGDGDAGPRTLVEVAGLDRSGSSDDPGRLAEAVDDLARQLAGTQTEEKQ
ncbi:cytochrome c biogenesis protein ResB [Nocardioides massiliensis]|uniref:Cytochrome c biogenesis protein n=1 Tax=Nocardioides massiliensis TaxID=1325935 RepID=A0ABT9NSI2_9ACTN|nr:cytochrome c biogenesis protein ResB [Nocardioides massiliensis]MDP9823276.1 cytochrome c biogenesis protein [Nocardioides massiliensis]